jgi:hypothetical protein
MEELIQVLTEIDSSDIKPKEILTEKDSPLVSKIRELLDEVLIAKDGHVNWDNRDKLIVAGWYSYPYEQDRFGWLVGALVTKKGDIVFG